MRTTKDRIRHTLLFEGIALLLTVLIAPLLLDHSPLSLGALALILSLIAMSWNYLYNLLFDKWQAGIPPQHRSIKMRVLHAAGFEGGLVLIGLPLIAWWLQIGLWQALITDIGFSIAFMCYALVFNWGYDKVFPVEIPALVSSSQETA